MSSILTIESVSFESYDNRNLMLSYDNGNLMLSYDNGNLKMLKT